MAYHITDARVGSQPIADTSATAQHKLGTIVRAFDPTYGEGEFVYLLGVASTVVGSPVSWDPLTHQTALCPVGNNIARPVAFAMSANLAAGYGWYQISGKCIASKGATICCVAGAGVGVKTIGFISKTGTGTELQGALCAATASAKTGVITVLLAINRPHMQGRVT
jgi:hypothetical protein